MPKISRRTENLGTENSFVVLAEVNELARRGKDLVSFCIGQPDFHTPANIQDAAVRAIREGKHGYTPSAGIAELREAAARYMGRMRGLSIRPEDVVIGGGAKPFIAYAILSTTDYGVGDEVIYPNPGFPIYESQIVANGAVPVPLHLREARNFAFDPAELESKITKKTKLVILNSPQNPTGGILAKKDLEAISGPQEDAEKMRASFLDRRNLIVGLLNKVPGVSCKTPGGAFYAWPNVTEACRMTGAADSEEFRKRLLNDAGVAVLADIHFGARVPGEGQHIRFSYAASKAAIEQGIARMAEFIRKNQRRVA